jgi:asparagine synthase (glutamine-hydrolysing)
MCGLAGRIQSAEVNATSTEGEAQHLLRNLQHRGPDGQGTFTSADSRLLLVHARLAILDLSSAGLQPLSKAFGQRRLTIAFNGEIYNFRELRARLEAAGHQFSTNTDTEVLLTLYAAYGKACLTQLRGMFAFAIWDEADRSLFLARDPLGIKPLYITEQPGFLGFASEVRPLLEAGYAERKLCPEGLQTYFQFGSVGGSGSILKGVRVLAAGSYLLWQEDRVVEERPYWNGPAHYSSPQFTGETIAVAREGLNSSVKAHLVSDVPVGLFLSGGMDSTTMAILAKQQGLADLRTFSIGFAEPEFDESALTKRTAEAVGATHSHWNLTSEEAKDMTSDYLASLDQPSTDGFNTYCVSKFAREAGCKVVLSGLGGDELFGGYPSFTRVPKLRKLHTSLPVVRKLVAGLLQTSSRPAFQRLAEYFASNGSPWSAWDTCRSHHTRADATSLTQHFLGEKSDWRQKAPDQKLDDRDVAAWQETSQYMHNQLLRDSDVMSMRWGLELRVPLVDRELFEQVAAIPASLRLLPNKGLLAAAMPEIPDWVLNQPKRGFAFPFAKWFAGDWQDMLANSTKALPVPLKTWYHIWAVFVLRNWCERWSIPLKG